MNRILIMFIKYCAKHIMYHARGSVDHGLLFNQDKKIIFVHSLIIEQLLFQIITFSSYLLEVLCFVFLLAINTNLPDVKDFYVQPVYLKQRYSAIS